MSDIRTEVRIATVDVSVFGVAVKTIEMEPKPGRGAGWVEQLYLVGRGGWEPVFKGKENEEEERGAGVTRSLYLSLRDTCAAMCGDEKTCRRSTVSPHMLKILQVFVLFFSSGFTGVDTSAGTKTCA